MEREGPVSSKFGRGAQLGSAALGSMDEARAACPLCRRRGRSPKRRRRSELDAGALSSQRTHPFQLQSTQRAESL
eukprot:2666512-Rhodomonas_salina.1